ncbi:MAG: HAMP domain-containing histidine kinase [Bacteroidales bacterium]|nr:HAMP domain-containing histidine kinase [Bacteroidales bacterium]
MRLFRKIFNRENNRYARTAVTGLVTLLLAVLVLVCNLTLTPQQVNTSYFLSLSILFLYVMLMYFFSGTLMRVLTIATRLKYHRTLKFVLMLAYILVMRFLTISVHRPRLLFQTMFFTSQGYLENFYAESIGVLFVDVCIYLSLAVFGTRYFADYSRTFISRQRKTAGLVLLAELFVVLALSTLVPYIVGRFASWGRFELNPCNMMNFDGNSIMFTFIVFGLGLGYSLLLKKILGTVFRYFQRRPMPAILFLSGAFALDVLFCVLLKRFFFGFPVWIWLVVVAAHLVVSLFWMRFERQNYRFFIVLGKLLIFSFITAILISYQLQKRDGEIRNELVKNLIVTTPVKNPFNYAGTQEDTVKVDRFFAGVYSDQTLPIGYAWVVKSERHLDREAIMRHPDETAQTSFAYYADGRLVDQYGGFDYLMNVKAYLDDIRYDSKHSCIIANNFRHFFYPISPNEMVVVSYRITSQFSLLAAFSFYFIAYILFYVMVVLVGRPFIRMARPLSLYNNLLWSGMLLLLIVGGALSVLSIYHSISRWSGDRAGLVKVKIGKVESDLNRSFGQLEQVRVSRSEQEVDSLLSALYKQYDLLVSVYDTNGRMLYSASTDLIAQPREMPAGVLAMMQSGYSYYRVKESTDYKNILCIYKVIQDDRGSVVGYLSGADIRNRYAALIKISNLITKHLYFFAWLILLSLASSFLIYFIIYRSMGALGSSMRKRNRPYSPIRLDWEVNEEIGALIQEHNQMVDELRANAVQMAKSEREAAWREMALEVAHEVNNPLTPMRLKMQLLQKAWLSNRPDIGIRIGEATDEVIRQTDALAEVADTFSEFASSQVGTNTDNDLRKLLLELVDELSGFVPATYNLHIGPRTEYRALIDRNLFRQMVRNLVRNAYHSRPASGRLSVTLTLDDDEDAAFWLMTFAANDCGLDLTGDEDVFSIRFSSVNCGHSLCLPIVKNIVVSFNGEIAFETSRESGTKFAIKIPKL